MRGRCEQVVRKLRIVRGRCDIGLAQRLAWGVKALVAARCWAHMQLAEWYRIQLCGVN